MHFHLPKPLHGWREFAGEVGVIVLGVLIALGFEWVVSSVRDHSSASQTRRYIRSEIEGNLSNILARQRTEACMARRMQEIAIFLGAPNQSARPSWIGMPYVPLAGNTQFKSAQNAGKFFLLPQKQQQELAVFYVDGDDFNTADTREWYDWAQLQSVASPTSKLTDTEVTRLQQALQDARAADWLIRLDSAEFVRLAHSAKMAASRPRITNQVPSVCLPINTPYAKGAAQAGTKDVPYPG